MNVLVTGVNGFVGPYLVSEIKKYFGNENIRIYGTYYEDKHLDGLSDIALYNLNILDKRNVYEVIKNIKPDYVFHLAAQSSVAMSWREPQLTFDINVNGTINLLSAVKAINERCKILIVGSSDEYGNIQYLPIDEEHSLNPQSPYAVSKVSQEMIARIYTKAYDMNIIMTRSFNHIGPSQEPTFVISDWAKQVADIERGLKEPVINVGNIQVRRDFTDVRDIVNAYVKLIDKGEIGEVYNVGSGNMYKLEDILKSILTYTSKDIEIRVNNDKIRPIENEEIQCDNSKIREHIDWNISYKIEDILLDVIRYWRDKNE